MTYEVSKETKAIIKTAKGEFGKASLALVRAAAGIAVAYQIERVNGLSIPAARRPKASEVKEAIRAEFGGLEKEGNRQAYDLCSLAFRVHAKVDKEAESVMVEGVRKGVVWFEGQVSALAGRATVDAWKAWVTGEQKPKVEKTPGEKLVAYFEKNAGDVDSDTLAKLGEMVAAEIARRAMVEAEKAA